MSEFPVILFAVDVDRRGLERDHHRSVRLDHGARAAVAVERQQLVTKLWAEDSRHTGDSSIASRYDRRSRLHERSKMTRSDERLIDESQEQPRTLTRGANRGSDGAADPFAPVAVLDELGVRQRRKRSGIAPYDECPGTSRRHRHTNGMNDERFAVVIEQLLRPAEPR